MLRTTAASCHSTTARTCPAGAQSWQARSTPWKANGEILSCLGGGKAGWLTYEKEYGDFVLKVDWKISKDGNSGVGLRYPATGKASASQEGMEIQILDDNAPIHATIKPAQHTGSIYELIAPKQAASKPVGEWNTYEITCKESGRSPSCLTASKSSMPMPTKRPFRQRLESSRR